MTWHRAPRSGPGADQLSYPQGDSIRCRRSEVGEAVYHQKTKNLLVSYSPKKLGFF
ncbi:hypothetical protein ACWD26_00900 [Streptomyces sp. NPDC002787]